MKHALLFLFFAVACLAADDRKPTPLPDTVTLKNGAVLKKVSVIRWQKDAVVLKHQGGADPIRFEHMSSESRTIFESHREAGLAGEEIKKKVIRERTAAEEESRQAVEVKKKRIAEAISERSLIVGMTESEAVQSWGQPTTVNESDGARGRRAQWVYRKPSEKPVYVYFEDGFLKSWQR